MDTKKIGMFLKELRNENGICIYDDNKIIKMGVQSKQPVNDETNNKEKNSKKTIISNSQSGGKDQFKNIIIRKKSPSEKTLNEQAIISRHKEETKRLGKNFLKHQNTMEDFFNNDSFNEFAMSYNNTILNQQNSGFDLKEAVNPTEDLEDIMKAFDLDD